MREREGPLRAETGRRSAPGGSEQDASLRPLARALLALAEELIPKEADER